jgi:hypothetical protein
MSIHVTFLRVLTYAAVVYLSWIGMQAVHELGHVLTAWVTGGTVARVILHPLAISRTDVLPNPAPLAVAWGGPIFGAATPLLLAMAVRIRQGNFVIRAYADFFAGFCLIANGAYIGVGSVDGIGDAGDLLRQGSPHWELAAFGVVSSVAGLLVWHLALKRRRRG